MKRAFLLLIMTAILISGTTPATAQRKKKRAEEFRKISAIIDSSYYQFRIQSISPSGRRTIHFNSFCAITVEDTLCWADLPYYGRTFESPYERNGSISFVGKPADLKIEKNEKKRTVSVSYTIDGEDDQFNVNMQVGAGGYGTVYISCRSRQPITYNGVIGALEKPAP